MDFYKQGSSIALQRLGLKIAGAVGQSGVGVTPAAVPQIPKIKSLAPNAQPAPAPGSGPFPTNQTGAGSIPNAPTAQAGVTGTNTPAATPTAPVTGGTNPGAGTKLGWGPPRAPMPTGGGPTIHQQTMGPTRTQIAARQTATPVSPPAAPAAPKPAGVAKRIPLESAAPAAPAAKPAQARNINIPSSTGLTPRT